MSSSSESDASELFTGLGQEEYPKALKPILIGITGGTASGKTTLFHEINNKIGGYIAYLGFDSFYKGLITEEEKANVANYNFDHPNSLDFEAAYSSLCKLMNGEDC